MFSSSKVSQAMIDAVNSVLGQTKPEPVQEVKSPEEGGKVPFAPAVLTEASEKVPTPTGMKVYGSSYGNSKKARADQTKSSVDNLKGPKDKEMKEDLKGNQDKIDANHNGKIDAQDFAILRGKKKMKENLSFADRLLETVRKSDVPAYLRKAKGDTPLTMADAKGPKKDTISAPENLAKARNEEVELTEHSEKFAKSHGFSWHPDTYGATMSHPEHGHININRYGEWTHHEKKGIGGRGVGIAMAHGNDQESLHHHLMKLNEETSKKKPAWLLAAELKAEKKEGKLKKEEVEQIEERDEGKHNNGKTTGFKVVAAKAAKEYGSKEAGNRVAGAVRAKILAKEEVTEEQLDEMINEVLSKDADAGDWIHDFVHSKNPKFAGKSKAERKKMALGAYYGHHKEEADFTTDELDGRKDGCDSNAFTNFKKKLKGDVAKTPAPEDTPKETVSSKSIKAKDNKDVKPELDKKYGNPTPQSHFEEYEQVEEKVIAGTPGWKETPKDVKDKSGAVHTPMSRAKDLARSAFKKIKNETMMGKAGTTSESKKKW